jgi:hypothetical protein
LDDAQAIEVVSVPGVREANIAPHEGTRRNILTEGLPEPDGVTKIV